ncbi:MAG: cytochrome P450 [Flavobacteriales bacterium]|nr:MAG: cytochrome P450 [Flavobacteriales bacterium]
MNDLPTVTQFEVFKNRKDILKNPLPFHHHNFQKFGDTFRVNIGYGKSIVFTRDPALIKHVLQKQHKNYQKSPLQTVQLAKYVGHGILTSNGEHWRTHRRMVQPAFHKKKLMGLMCIMQLAIRDALKAIKSDEVNNVPPFMGDFAFQVVARSLFSRNDIERPMQRLQQITERNQKMLIREMRKPYLNWWFYLSGAIKKHLALSKEGRNILNTIIEDRLRSGREGDDLLDMLLNASYEDGTPMSREQLLDEVLILFTAGHETTANALSFSLYFLAKQQAVQEKAFQEVAKLDMEEGDIMENLSLLPYVKQCIEEALRLYPPAYVIDRIAVAEDIFEGRTIKKDTMILMSVYELHRYESFWESPGDFVPERFDKGNGKDFQEYYYPFGAGPRMCVGNNFAMYEMILTVAEVLKRFQLQTDMDTLDINPLISLKPNAIPIKFIKR